MTKERNKRVRYYDDDFEVREGTKIERNGNLTLVETDEGEPLWLAPFEIERNKEDRR